VSRWKSATVQFWLAEPAAPLALYCLLVVAQLGYIRLTVFGLHRSIGFPHDDFMIVHPGWVLISVYFAWRIWLGGAISWTLLVISGVLQIVASVSLAWGATGSPFALGMLPFSAACLVLLFMPAVLDRASDAGRLKISARPRRSRYGQQVSSPNRYYVN
jgi:hypothetical protein